MNPEIHQRTFAVGDVHGQLAMLADLISQLIPRAVEGDTLLFVGDYIDRGPDSRGVVEQVLALREGAWPGPVVTLRGNHEDLMLDEERTRKQYDAGLWLENGGVETIRSYRCEISRAEFRAGVGLSFLPDAHRVFFGSLDLWYEDAHALYVHAGMRPGYLPDSSSERELLWIRDEFIYSSYEWGKPVVFGHTPQAVNNRRICLASEVQWGPLNRPEKIGIDTGVCYGGPLTAVMLPEREFFVVAPSEAEATLT
jgi:serine/threonine protein phosphatase 1